MNKKLLAAAVVAAVAASPAAFADSTVYGKLHTSIDYNDFDGDKNFSVESRASRLGFKGSEDLGGGLKAIYQIEFGISSDGGNQQTNAYDDNVVGGLQRSPRSPVNNHRNTFIGLAGDWGTALVGRHDTPMKMAFYASGNERLGDSAIDLNRGASVLGVFQEVRASNTIAYVSPNFSGFTVAAAIIPGEEFDGLSTGPTASGAYNPTGVKASDGLADHYSFGAMYSGNGLKASAGYEVLDNQAGLVSAGAGNNDMKTWQLGASYTMNAFSFGGEYQNTKDFGFVDGRDYDAWALTGKWTMGNNAIAAVYTNSKDKRAAGDWKTDGWGLSGEHNFSKRSKVYAAYAYNKEKRPVLSDVKDQVFSLGMIHNF